MRIELRRVAFMPRELEPGVLYVAEEFGAAAHLCPCGCGAKVRTPLGPIDWSLEDTPSGPSLSPSIGNWQQACRSHYWIRNGLVMWAEPWTEEEIAAGRARERQRVSAYYGGLDRERNSGVSRRILTWIRAVLRRLPFQ
jgi:hypothetical protein